MRHALRRCPRQCASRGKFDVQAPRPAVHVLLSLAVFVCAELSSRWVSWRCVSPSARQRVLGSCTRQRAPASLHKPGRLTPHSPPVETPRYTATPHEVMTLWFRSSAGARGQSIIAQLSGCCGCCGCCPSLCACSTESEGRDSGCSSAARRGGAAGGGAGSGPGEAARPPAAAETADEAARSGECLTRRQRIRVSHNFVQQSEMFGFTLPAGCYTGAFTRSAENSCDEKICVNLLLSTCH